MKERHQLHEDIINYIIDYIPYTPCSICQKKINVLHSKNYYWYSKHFLFCSNECYNYV